MASNQESSNPITLHPGWKKWLFFVAGMVAGIMLLSLAGFFVLYSGAINFAASAEPLPLEDKVAPWIVDRSMARRQNDEKNPYLNNPEALKTGMVEYREMCLICHGAPNIAPSELMTTGLNPRAPKLHADDTQELSDGQLFWIVKNGIRMTGMPACGATHDDKTILKVVAFVRHLPKLTPEEQASLRSEAEGEAHEQSEHQHEHSEMAHENNEEKTTGITGDEHGGKRTSSA